MNKSELIEALSLRTNTSKKAAKETVEPPGSQSYNANTSS